MKKNGQNSRRSKNRFGWFKPRAKHCIKDAPGDSKSRYSKAIWALRLYDLLENKHSIHIRRLHYFALARGGVTLPDGRPYRNTLDDLGFLSSAFDHARLLNLVPYDVFSDHQNNIHARIVIGPARDNHRTTWQVLLKRRMARACRMHIRAMHARAAAVHIEVWLERTAAVDIIESTAEKYNLNIVASEKEIPLTNVWHFIRRVANISKPVRIFYFCDFDQAALSMPAIDKLKSALFQYGLSRKIDLDVQKLVLTRRECEKFALPPRPGTEAETAELHALEVAAPGYMCNSLEKHVKPHIDLAELSDSMKGAGKSMNELMRRIETMINNRN